MIRKRIGRNMEGYNIPSNALTFLREYYSKGFEKLALNEKNGAFLILKDGVCDWEGEFPESMKKAATRGTVTSVSCGTKDQFFFLFKDRPPYGNFLRYKRIRWNQVIRVGFSKSRNSYVVSRRKGDFVWNGIDKDLDQLLRKKKNKPVKVFVGLGGEYFIKFQNGRWIANAPDSGLRRYLQDLQANGRKIDWIKFGNRPAVVKFGNA